MLEQQSISFSFCQITALDEIKLSSEAQWKENLMVYAPEAARINSLMDKHKSLLEKITTTTRRKQQKMTYSDELIETVTSVSADLASIPTTGELSSSSFCSAALFIDIDCH